jgi:translocation and assembly module TamB
MRPLRAVAHAHVSAIVFACALVAGAVLHLSALPIARRTLQEGVNRGLAPLFAGRITIDRIGFFGLTRIDGLDAHVDGPDGKTVLRVEGASAHVSTLALLRSLFKSSGPLLIRIPDLSIARADAKLDADAGGVPRIASAFALRTPPKPGDPPGRDVVVALPRIHLVHAGVRAQPSAPHDGDLDDADASFSFTPATLVFDLARARLRVRGLPEGAQARGDAKAHLEKPSNGPLRLRASWDGSVGAIREQANVGMDGAQLDATIDAGPATAEEVRAVWPQWPLGGPAAAHAEGHGRLPRIDVTAHASALGGDVSVAGPVTLGASVDAALHVEMRGLSGGTLIAPVPVASVGGSGDVTLALAPNGSAEARVAFTLTHGDWETERERKTEPIPMTAITADLTRSSEGEAAFRANVTIREAGAPAVIALQLAPKGGGPAKNDPLLSFQADVSALRLQSVPRLRGVASGDASLHAFGTVDPARGVIVAQVLATSTALAWGNATVNDVRAEAHASGTFSSPVVRVALEGQDVRAGRLRADEFRADAELTFNDGVAFRDVDVCLASDGPLVRVRAAAVRLDGGQVRVDHAIAEGLGEPLEATLRVSQAGIVIRAESAGIDLSRLTSFAFVPAATGRLAIDVDATVERDSVEGRVALDLSRGEVAGLKGASAQVEVRLHGRKIAGHATASAQDLGTLEVTSSSLEVGRGDLVTASPWRQAWGAVDVKAHADLAKCFAHLFPDVAKPRPLDDVRGQVDAGIRLERDSPSDMTPEIDMTASTTGLALSGRRAAGEWRLAGIDPELSAVVNGTTGATAISGQVHDAAGPLATFEATSAAVPYSSLFSDFSSASMLAALAAMPFAAHVDVPARPLASLPPALGTAGLRGVLSAKVDWSGTVVAPLVNVAATLARGPSDPAVVALPLDFALAAHYDGATLDASLFGSWHGKAMLDASARVDARARDVVSGFGGADVPWTASANARLTKMPLRNAPMLDDRQVQGSVSGDVTLTGLHTDARASVALRFDDLEVGDATCRSASARAEADGRAFDGSIQIDDAKGGHMQTRAHFGLHWGAALLPALDVAQPAEASLSAKAFRAALLLPFVSGIFTELDGTLDADARIAIDAAHGSGKPQGTLRLKDGAFELASMGGAFHGVDATLAVSPDGVLRLEHAVAHGTSGEILGSATGRMDGLSLAAVRATVEMPRADPLPLVFDGVQLGMLDGRFDLDLRHSASGMDIAVQVPSLHLALPAGSAARDVEALGGIDSVDIGVTRGSEFALVPLDAVQESDAAHGPEKSFTRIAVRLGGDVQVARGTDLDVRLEGQPTITLDGDVRVNGQIRLVRGTLDVKGKAFVIERGTITFTGDPSNPQVVLTAGWPAPDGTRIYADFVGPLKTGKVTLRAEPSRPQNEILALLLFGATDNGSSGDSQGYTAGAQAGGAVATQPINQALGGLNRSLDKLGLSGGISTKVDTSTPNPRPEVELQIARDISIQIGVVLGVPPITNPDTTLVTLNWNFLRKWSLETTVGDAGTSIVDVIWQHRY